MLSRVLKGVVATGGPCAGYFDVRDRDDRWIRIACNKGDMIVLPEGIYHRFTLDESNYIKVRTFGLLVVPHWRPF